MALKAIFFDLDDTLMDTYGQLVLKAHREACQAMIEAGLAVEIDTLYQKRLELLKSHPREDINQLLAEHFNSTDPKIVEAAFQAYYNTDVRGIQPFPQVPELLTSLGQEFELFLVTTGSPPTQQKKVKELKLGSYFKEAYYVDMAAQETKGQAFSYLLETYAYQPAEVLVVGDRINNEILYANRLGCLTVWIQHGEFAHVEPAHFEEKPNFTIQNIHDLNQIVAILKES